MIVVHTAGLAGPFRFPAEDYRWSVHPDGDLTVAHHERGLVACFNRHQWVSVMREGDAQ